MAKKENCEQYRRRNLGRDVLQNWICWLKNWKTETHRWRTLLYCTDRAWNFLKLCSGKLDTVEKKMLQLNEDGTFSEFSR